MPPSIAVVTPAISERLYMLFEAIQSVNEQTLSPKCHLIGIDHDNTGCAANQTALAFEAIERGCDWVALLADDDMFYPEHLETLASRADDGDVIYSYCDVEGRDWNPNAPFDEARLRQGNYIPSTTLIRSTLITELGGWKSDAEHGFEDHRFWLDSLDIGARFICIEAVTWKYRFHGTNISWR